MSAKAFRGFILIEVLIAISVLAIGATSAVKVFGQSLRASQHLEEITLGKSLVESLLFKVQTGELPQLLEGKGGYDLDEITLSDQAETHFNYDVVSELFEGSEIDYKVTVRISDILERELIKTTVLMRNENPKRSNAR